jgi:NitT/TauT family transport system substrate-binding protein
MTAKLGTAGRTLARSTARHGLLIALVGALVLALVACTPDEPDTTETESPVEPAEPSPEDGEDPSDEDADIGELEKSDLSIALIPISETLAIAAAEEQGFFEEAGLTVEVQRVGSGAEAIPLLAGGRIDAMFSNTVTTLQAIQEGLDAVFLTPAGWAREDPPDTSSAVMVRADDDIDAPSDLAGRRVATNVIGSIAWLYFAEWLNQNGVPHDEVTFAEVPFPQMIDALLGGSVDAIFPPDPFRTIAEGTGEISSLGYGFIEVQPGVEISQYVTTRAWLEEHPNTARAFVSAVRRGADFINANEAEAREINVRWTGLSEELKDDVMITRLGTATNEDSIRRTMDLMLEYGLLEEELELEQYLVDTGA